MDDAFSLTASEMPRTRRLSSFGVRAIVALVMGMTLLTTFTSFVVSQQRAADERRSAAIAAQATAREAETRIAAAQAAASPASPGASKATVDDLLDARARTAASGALDDAVAFADTASLEAAGAGALASVDDHLVFVDGPSTGPSVVSVFASDGGWAAAVQGSARTCFWIAVVAGGSPRYGSGMPCTGIAALAADRTGW
jgi:type II secretory pathway pseudopilin PulG